MYWSTLRSAVCRSWEVKVALSPVEAPWWASARSVSTSALIGSGAGRIEVRMGSWADQKSFTMVSICSGVPDPRSAFIRTRAAAVSESTHAEHTAWVRSALVGEAATDDAGGVAGVAELGAPPQAVVVASASTSIPSGRPMWSRQGRKATDSPRSPSAARPGRGYCAAPLLDSMSAHRAWAYRSVDGPRLLVCHPPPPPPVVWTMSVAQLRGATVGVPPPGVRCGPRRGVIRGAHCSQPRRRDEDDEIG